MIIIQEGNIGSKVSDIARNNTVSDISPQARETKEQNKQIGLNQTKKVLHSKGGLNKVKRFVDTSDKELISKIYSVLTRLNTKKPNNPI